MIEIAFAACLIVAPTTCEDKAMQFADMSMMACMMGAQPQLAHWVGEHPGWQIRHWSCRVVGSGHSA